MYVLSEVEGSTSSSIKDYRGKTNNDKGLLNYYYINIRLLRYEPDLYSTDVLHQAIRRLPSKF